MKAKDVINLIKELPDSDKHIQRGTSLLYGDMVCVTDEWLVGSFPGVGFMGKTEEEAADKLIEYLDKQKVNKIDSIVKGIVNKSGWPDLDKVREYCLNIN